MPLKNRSRSNTPSQKGKSKSKSKSKTTSPHHPNISDKYSCQAFRDALEDVHTRFILNLPAEELATSDRIFFQIEQAWWFYEDFLCDDMEPEQSFVSPKKENKDSSEILLPRFNNVKTFAIKLFEISPLLSPLLPKFDSMWIDFSKYRRKISTYGTILLNENCSKVVLCQVYGGKSFTFPAGKVNQNENGVDAGARETYEETGFDPNCNLGRTKLMKENAKDDSVSVPWKELAEEDALGYVEDGTGKRRTCYVCRGVPESFPFSPVARKEVGAIEWHDLNNLPKKTYAVHPFMSQLKRWIRNYNKRNKKREKKKRAGSSVKGRSNSQGSSRSNSIIDEKDNLFRSGLGNVGDENGWDENDMLRKNEELIGHKIQYDGNPQKFAAKGFDGVDPHAFRVVGGKLMNSAIVDSNEKASDKIKLQSLLNRNGVTEEEEKLKGKDLQPFFAANGATPWGELMAEALSEETSKTARKNDKINEKKIDLGSSNSFDVTSPSIGVESFKNVSSNSQGLSILNMIRGGSGSNNDLIQGNKKDIGHIIPAVSESAPDPPSPDVDAILTNEDSIIIGQSEHIKKIKAKNLTPKNDDQGDEGKTRLTHVRKEKQVAKVNETKTSECSTMERMREWVHTLPYSEPTKHFGDFRFDVNAIMKAIKHK